MRSTYRTLVLSVGIAASVPALAQQSAGEDCSFVTEDSISFEIRTGTSDASEVRRFQESLLPEQWSELVPDRYGRPWLVGKDGLLTSSDIATIAVEQNPQAFLGEAAHLLRLRLTNDGAKKFLRVTEVRTGRHLVFLLNRKFAGAVVVREPILIGSVQVVLPKCSEEELTTIASRIMKSNPAVHGTPREKPAQRP